MCTQMHGACNRMYPTGRVVLWTIRFLTTFVSQFGGSPTSFAHLVKNDRLIGKRAGISSIFSHKNAPTAAELTPMTANANPCKAVGEELLGQTFYKAALGTLGRHCHSPAIR